VEQHAKTHHPPRLNAPMTVFSPEGDRIVCQFVEGLVADLPDLLDAADMVCHGPHDARVVDVFQAFHHSGEPPRGHEGIVVEKENMPARGGLDSLVAALRETKVFLVFDQPVSGILTDEFAEPLNRPVGRAVVHEDDLVSLRCVLPDALDASLRVLQFVEGEDHDGDRLILAVDFL